MEDGAVQSVLFCFQFLKESENDKKYHLSKYSCDIPALGRCLYIRIVLTIYIMHRLFVEIYKFICIFTCIFIL